MRLMLQREEPEEFVIATGDVHSVREPVQVAFGQVGLVPEEHLRIDPRFRPAEAEHQVGD